MAEGGDGTVTFETMTEESAGEQARGTVGVLGFGKVGTVLARLAHQAGYRVLAAGSGDPVSITLTAEVLTPGVEVAWAADVIDAADIVILAIPLHAHRNLPVELFAGKIVVDAVNHWSEVDGPRENWLGPDESSSEHLRDALPGARLVKGFNHLGYHDLDERSRPVDAADRVAVALASDDRDALNRAARLVTELGFDPLPIGGLKRGRILEPGSPIFGAVLDSAGLAALVAAQTSPQPAP
jgi:8-hydroxy-5-deazaflavin:NADPH oxidoreductase